MYEATRRLWPDGGRENFKNKLTFHIHGDNSRLEKLEVTLPRIRALSNRAGAPAWAGGGTRTFDRVGVCLVGLNGPRTLCRSSKGQGGGSGGEGNRYQMGVVLRRGGIAPGITYVLWSDLQRLKLPGTLLPHPHWVPQPVKRKPN